MHAVVVPMMKYCPPLPCTQLERLGVLVVVICVVTCVVDAVRSVVDEANVEEGSSVGMT